MKKMKRNIIHTLLVSLVALTGFTSCESWLDASPKSQIEEEEHFSREGGYKDQLTGVYTKMSSTDLYGLNTGIGFTEVLSQNYDVNVNGEWRYAAQYDYTNSSVETILNNIWLNAYNCITNLNLMLENLETADRNIFSDNNYEVYRGEALGLRAFLHLDLMRMFACSPAMNSSANGVPYVTEYSTKVVAQKSVKETMQLIINDLKEAKEWLKSDSLYCSSSPYSQRSSRICYFNYYAATLTLARAYLWNGDTENALKEANEIIDVLEGSALSKPFSWVHYTTMSDSHKENWDRAFSCEQIFYLKINQWEDIANYYLKSDGGTSSLAPSQTKADDIYELNSGLGNDYRYLKGYENDGENRYCAKLWYIEGSGYNNLYPMLRPTEAFYIAAECLKSSNSTRAIELLNEVRENRNLSLLPLADNLTSDQIQEEIFKEYRKEFVCEGGQLFFYYKRLNASEIKGASVRPGKSVYVMPIPSNDAEFGGYSN
jgi:hypothetical protein